MHAKSVSYNRSFVQIWWFRIFLAGVIALGLSLGIAQKFSAAAEDKPDDPCVEWCADYIVSEVIGEDGSVVAKIYAAKNGNCDGVFQFPVGTKVTSGFDRSVEITKTEQTVTGCVIVVWIEPPPNFIEIPLYERTDSGLDGRALLIKEDDKSTTVILEVYGAEDGLELTLELNTSDDCFTSSKPGISFDVKFEGDKPSRDRLFVQMPIDKLADRMFVLRGGEGPHGVWACSVANGVG